MQGQGIVRADTSGTRFRASSWVQAVCLDTHTHRDTHMYIYIYYTYVYTYYTHTPIQCFWSYMHEHFMAWDFGP